MQRKIGYHDSCVDNLKPKGRCAVKKFVVMTDSACDLPQELADQHHIDIVCFKIALDGEGYTERVDFTPEQYSSMLREAKGLPTTSQSSRLAKCGVLFRERILSAASPGRTTVLSGTVKILLPSTQPPSKMRWIFLM